MGGGARGRVARGRPARGAERLPVGRIGRGALHLRRRGPRLPACRLRRLGGGGRGAALRRGAVERGGAQAADLRPRARRLHARAGGAAAALLRAAARILLHRQHRRHGRPQGARAVDGGHAGHDEAACRVAARRGCFREHGAHHLQSQFMGRRPVKRRARRGAQAGGGARAQAAARGAAEGVAAARGGAGGGGGTREGTGGLLACQPQLTPPLCCDAQARRWRRSSTRERRRPTSWRRFASATWPRRRSTSRAGCRRRACAGGSSTSCWAADASPSRT